MGGNIRRAGHLTPYAWVIIPHAHQGSGQHIPGSLRERAGHGLLIIIAAGRMGDRHELPGNGRTQRITAGAHHEIRLTVQGLAGLAAFLIRMGSSALSRNGTAPQKVEGIEYDPESC